MTTTRLSIVVAFLALAVPSIAQAAPTGAPIVSHFTPAPETKQDLSAIRKNVILPSAKQLPNFQSLRVSKPQDVKQAPGFIGSGFPVVKASARADGQRFTRTYTVMGSSAVAQGPWQAVGAKTPWIGPAKPPANLTTPAK